MPVKRAEDAGRTFTRAVGNLIPHPKLPWSFNTRDGRGEFGINRQRSEDRIPTFDQ